MVVIDSRVVGMWDNDVVVVVVGGGSGAMMMRLEVVWGMALLVRIGVDLDWIRIIDRPRPRLRRGIGCGMRMEIVGINHHRLHHRLRPLRDRMSPICV